MIDVPRDVLELLAYPVFSVIAEREAVGLLAETNDLLSKLYAALTAFCPYIRQSYVHVTLPAGIPYHGYLRVRIRCEAVDRDDHRQMIDVQHVVYMAHKVRETCA